MPDFVKRPGMTWIVPFTVLDVVDGVASPFTGLDSATLTATLSDLHETTPAWTGTEGDGVSVVNNAQGKAQVELEFADTASLITGHFYRLDLVVLDPGGNRQLGGSVVIEAK
jgi:hypothetical protein